MRQKALGRLHSEDTKLKMNAVSGNPVNIYEKCFSEEYKLIGGFVSARRAVNIYEKCFSEEYKLIGGFVSARRAGKFLGISVSTVRRYMNSGEVFKDRYKFLSK